MESPAMDAAAVGHRPRLLQRLGWSHRDAVGFVVAVAASVAILINVLFWQAAPHPAPMVRSGVIAAIAVPPASTPAGPALAGSNTTLPRPRSADATPKAEQSKADLPKEHAKVASTGAVPGPAAQPGRVNAAVVSDIQRELSRRGYYDGQVDGKYGPRTDAAIRDFEQASGLRPSTEPNEALLRAIRGSAVRSRPAARPPMPLARPDPIGELLAPSKQVIAVQRALSEFGYGQIKPTGIVDPETQSAIQRFERERRLPVTGQLSHRVVRELAAITGRPLE
jgi:peptidoglycan hydrolase-like protein with peptidoglycan-binding domain